MRLTTERFEAFVRRTRRVAQKILRRLNVAENVNDQQTTAIVDLRDDVATLRTQGRALKDRVDALEPRVDDLEARVTALEGQ